MNDAHDEDLVLVRRVQTARNDLRPFEELVRRHEGQVLANCRHLSGSADDAQDLAQEVFVKVFFGLPRFRGEARFGAWVQRIKVNHCLNFLRRKRRGGFLDAQDPALQDEPQLQVQPLAQHAAEARDERKLVAAVLDRLPDTLRIPLIMSDLDDLSYQEIADELGLGLSAVKMRIKRGREQFRRTLAELQAGD